MNDLLRRMLFLPDQASEHARQVDSLHYFVILTTMVAAAGVFIVAIYFFVRYRRRSDFDKTPHIEPKALHEVLFVAVPLALFLLWFAIGFPQYVNLSLPPKNAMDVYVVGKQWMWKFTYPGGPNSVDELRVPVNRPVRLLITSRDVIHSFFVPALRVKMDALPGRYTQTWFEADRPGRYDIFCSQYCGTGHSSMTGQLIVMPEVEFDHWMAQEKQYDLASAQDTSPEKGQALPAANLVEQGQRVAAEQGCLKCHSVDGSRHIGPTWVNLYEKRERMKDGTVVVADEGYLTESMMEPAAKIVDGYQNVMPTYQGKLSPPEVAAVIEYIKSLRTSPVPAGASEGPAYESIHRE